MEQKQRKYDIHVNMKELRKNCKVGKLIKSPKDMRLFYGIEECHEKDKVEGEWGVTSTLVNIDIG